MSDDIKNILNNSNKDIDNQKLMDYLSKQLSKQDQHDLEKMMAEDEFINDAVEGLEQFNNVNKLPVSVEQLNRELQKQIAKKKERKEKRKRARSTAMTRRSRRKSRRTRRRAQREWTGDGRRRNGIVSALCFLCVFAPAVNRPLPSPPPLRKGGSNNAGKGAAASGSSSHSAFSALSLAFLCDLCVYALWFRFSPYA